MGIKIACPVCGSSLIHERIDDGITVHEILQDCTVKYINSNSNGYDVIYCKVDKYHKLGKIEEEALVLAQDFSI